VLASSTPDVRLLSAIRQPGFINWRSVEDPATWTWPWTFAIRLKRTDAQVYEYACHEGNSSLIGILAGARADEAKAAARK
jgi:hypothetical protein